MVFEGERKKFALGARFFFIASRPAKGRIELVFIKRLFQPFRLPHIGMQRTMVKRVNACACASGFPMHKQPMPASSAAFWRNLYISRNFHVVSTCKSGKGGGAGKCLFGDMQHGSATLPME